MIFVKFMILNVTIDAVVALMAIKQGVKDPHNVLDNWDLSSVDPCSWKMVTCTSDGSVSALTLQNNEFSGPIPVKIGKLWNLQTLDLSGNKFSGELPSSLGNLKNLNLLRLNNNTLTGPVPESLSEVGGLTLVYVNLPYLFMS
ncbi:putative non-specific serine/threonine protein kinase [Helianthus annuus]|nr:putative non-specific serine/threonine protein kinase [Helianthus annuus]